jgi:polyhydroxyalkanoate synthase
MQFSPAPSAQKLTENLQQATMLWLEALQELSKMDHKGPMAEQRILQQVAEAFTQYQFALSENKSTDLMQLQWDWWSQSLSLWQQQIADFMRLPLEEKENLNLNEKDRRFRHELWHEHWFFDSVRKQYLLNAKMARELVSKPDESLDPHTAHQVEFYTRQWIDAMSPSNYPWSNPEVMKQALESDGESLVSGMKNLLSDLRKGMISMTKTDAFTLGENIATTPGSVVFENRLLQLIQYAPTTEKVHQIPVLITPAWINKYYILDLQQKNSLVRWLVDQGFTVFVVSWVNPDSSYKDTKFEDYLRDGIYTALQEVLKITGEKQSHMVGYCLGGTLQACLLAWLHQKNQQHKVASATYLTTLLDFTHAGDLKVFIDETQISLMEERMAEKGCLEGRELATTFNMLRPTDLIWSFVVQNYLLGHEPMPFDLLYWNSDVTAMPAAMHSYYLRNMYLHNKLIEPGALTLAGEKIDLRKIKTPTYMLSTREDHIAPWDATYEAVNHFSGATDFVLASSGHIAGVINPPSKQKYSYFTNNRLEKTPEAWKAKATEHAGSWWPHWGEWLAKRSGAKLAARKVGTSSHPIIEAAPGRYASKRRS